MDDTKEHRTSEDVWGTCTFHDSSARSPNRAETVRAHNWVVAGDFVAGQPWIFLPHSSRLYFRKSQLPVGETFQTKTQLAGEILRQVDTESDPPVLGIFDGAYAMETVVRPCLRPPDGQRRIEILARLRVDARLDQPPAGRARADGTKRPGPDAKWGRRMATPRNREKGDAPWRTGRAWIYGRMRKFRSKRVLCQWAVSGHDEWVHAFVFEVEGYEEPFFIVTSARDLSAAQVIEAFTAR